MYQVIPEILQQSAQRFALNPALAAVGASPVTYAEFNSQVRRATACLQSRGVERGQAVILLSESGPAWLTMFFAIVSAGGVVVPLMESVPVESLAFIAKFSGAKLAVFSERLSELGGKAFSQLPRLSPREAQEFSLEGEAVSLSGADLAVLAFTSGSTQAPRAVMLTHANITANLNGLLAVRRAEPSDVILSVLPPAHLFELIVGQLGPIACGARVVYLGAPIPNRILEALRSEGVTITVMVPGLVKILIRQALDELVAAGLVNPRWLAASDAELASELASELGSELSRETKRSEELRSVIGKTLKSIAIGGAAIHPLWGELLGALGIRLEVGYGLTESSPIVSMGFAGKIPRASVGQALPGTEVRLSENGEILVRGASVMHGYLHQPHETALVLKDGWLHTGDLGQLDSEGNLFIIGRLKEAMVNEGGDTIYPEEVEPLYALGEFAEFCVAPFRGEHANDIPLLIAVPKKNPLQDKDFAEALSSAFREARKKAPARLKVAGLFLLENAIPRTALAKPKRLELMRGIENKLAGGNAADLNHEDLWNALKKSPSFVL